MTLGFSTRVGGVSEKSFSSLNMSTSQGDSLQNVTENRSRFLNDLGISSNTLAIPNQISSDKVVEAHAPRVFADTDALFTIQPNVYLSVLTADCAPILFWSNEIDLIGAVHSGWQGSEKNILAKTLDLAHGRYNFDPASISMVIGPGLTQPNFEVGPEFSAKFHQNFLLPKQDSDRYYFDNNALLRDTAIQWGIEPAQIETLAYCSFDDERLLFSHRRDKGRTGRMMSVIGFSS